MIPKKYWLILYQNTQIIKCPMHNTCLGRRWFCLDLYQDPCCVPIQAVSYLPAPRPSNQKGEKTDVHRFGCIPYVLKPRKGPEWQLTFILKGAIHPVMKGWVSRQINRLVSFLFSITTKVAVLKLVHSSVSLTSSEILTTCPVPTRWFFPSANTLYDG